jgi:nitroimidazol reductase NimA-like FMN-containing flavoprotein (pyridoxamine 5'-phosphate oxidase superfamily)
MFGTLNEIELERLIAGQWVGRIACCDNGKPYMVPISYAYDGTFIYCHSDEGRKVNIMRRNPQVCFQVDEMKDMANWKSVVMEGFFEEITDPKERNDAMLTLLNRYLPVISSVTTHLGEHWPFYPDDASAIDGLIFKIRIQSKFGKFESNTLSPAIPG